MAGYRASEQFIKELERHIEEFERHLRAGGYSPNTVHTKARTGPAWLVRYLRGQTFIKDRSWER